ncbi:MAG: hypothetical protein U0136_11060 [Bdellovibrionota bacterium]
MSQSISDLLLLDSKTLETLADDLLSGKLTRGKPIDSVRELAAIDALAIYSALAQGNADTEQRMNDGEPIPVLLRALAKHYFVAALALLSLRFWVLHRREIASEYNRLGTAAELTAVHHDKLASLSLGRDEEEVLFIKGLLIKLVTVDIKTMIWSVQGRPPQVTAEHLRRELAMREQMNDPNAQANLGRGQTDAELLHLIDALTKSALRFFICAHASQPQPS